MPRRPPPAHTYRLDVKRATHYQVKYLLAGLILILLFAVFRRQQPLKTVDSGWTGMVGLTGTADQTFTTEGTVMVNGEIWKATSKRGIIHKGDRVRVVAMLPGLQLEVEQVSSHS